ncbi:hypothetical protein DFH06DRAFT_1309529 [Mycena polygramma]|nr:hypothetical protein DFH06DRAFT_1309529 [Mycena polygramma]
MPGMHDISKGTVREVGWIRIRYPLSEIRPHSTNLSHPQLLFASASGAGVSRESGSRRGGERGTSRRKGVHDITLRVGESGCGGSTRAPHVRRHEREERSTSKGTKGEYGWQSSVARGRGQGACLLNAICGSEHRASSVLDMADAPERRCWCTNDYAAPRDEEHRERDEDTNASIMSPRKEGRRDKGTTRMPPRCARGAERRDMGATLGGRDIGDGARVLRRAASVPMRVSGARPRRAPPSHNTCTRTGSPTPAAGRAAGYVVCGFAIVRRGRAMAGAIGGNARSQGASMQSTGGVRHEARRGCARAACGVRTGEPKRRTWKDRARRKRARRQKVRTPLRRKEGHGLARAAASTGGAKGEHGRVGVPGGRCTRINEAIDLCARAVKNAMGAAAGASKGAKREHRRVDAILGRGCLPLRHDALIDLRRSNLVKGDGRVEGQKKLARHDAHDKVTNLRRSHPPSCPRVDDSATPSDGGLDAGCTPLDALLRALYGDGRRVAKKSGAGNRALLAGGTPIVADREQGGGSRSAGRREAQAQAAGASGSAYAGFTGQGRDE